MKKSLIALAALGAFAGAASAQSSVTLFGIVDVGARAVKNGDGSTVKGLTNNGLATSRIGFRGEEDLGGGLKANFWLEGALDPDVGNAGSGASNRSVNGASVGGKFFGRRSTVGLSGPFGEVRFGRDYVASYNNLSQFDVYGNVGIGNLLNVIGNNGSQPLTSTTSADQLGSGAGTLVRADNAIGYLLPSNLGGLYGQVTVAAGEGTGSTNGHNRHVSGRIGFAAAGFDVAGAYGRTRIPNREDYKIWNIGASYNFAGYGKIMALYNRADFEQISQKTWSIGASVPLGAGELRATYASVDMNGGTAAPFRSQDDARQYAVGYIYNLSKRTAVYADVGRLDNKGQSQLIIPGGTAGGSGFPAAGAITTANDTTRRSTAIGVGVRHSF